MQRKSSYIFAMCAMVLLTIFFRASAEGNPYREIDRIDRIIQNAVEAGGPPPQINHSDAVAKTILKLKKKGYPVPDFEHGDLEDLDEQIPSLVAAEAVGHLTERDNDYTSAVALKLFLEGYQDDIFLSPFERVGSPESFVETSDLELDTEVEELFDGSDDPWISWELFKIWNPLPLPPSRLDITNFATWATVGHTDVTRKAIKGAGLVNNIVATTHLLSKRWEESLGQKVGRWQANMFDESLKEEWSMQEIEEKIRVREKQLEGSKKAIQKLSEWYYDDIEPLEEVHLERKKHIDEHYALVEASADFVRADPSLGREKKRSLQTKGRFSIMIREEERRFLEEISVINEEFRNELNPAIQNYEQLKAEIAVLKDYIAPIEERRLAREEEYPQELDENQMAVIQQILDLDYQRQKQVLEQMDSAHEDSVYRCLCRRGHPTYGTSARMSYHPDAHPDSSPGTTCGEPGDPCMRSGFGCGRHSLPTDPDIWEHCLGENFAEGLFQALQEWDEQR